MKLIFGGDFYVSNHFDIKNVEYIETIQERFSLDGLLIVNLESPITTLEKKIPKSGPHLKMSPKVTNLINALGINIVNLSNNHIGDYGTMGILDTITHLGKSKIKHCGVHHNDSFIQYIKDSDGTKVAVIALTEHEFSPIGESLGNVAEFEPMELVRLIRAARAKADFICILFHGGNEYTPIPRPGLRKMCKFCIDEGADIVIGSHTHVPGVREQYKGKWIYYSLGNFLFKSTKRASSPFSSKSFLLEVDFNTQEKSIKTNRVPFKVELDTYNFKSLGNDELVEFNKYLHKIDSILTDDERYQFEWDSFVSKTGPNLLSYIVFPRIFKGMMKVARIMKIDRVYSSRAQQIVHLNIMRCESHKEVLVDHLKRKSSK